MLEKKIHKILIDKKTSPGHKLAEIARLLPKDETEGRKMVDFCGHRAGKKVVDGKIIINGSVGHEYIDNPRLKNEEDLYYKGVGTTWDIDLDGKRYYKLYDPSKIRYDTDKYSHLEFGDKMNKEKIC